MTLITEKFIAKNIEFSLEISNIGNGNDLLCETRIQINGNKNFTVSSFLISELFTFHCRKTSLYFILQLIVEQFFSKSSWWQLIN